MKYTVKNIVLGRGVLGGLILALLGVGIGCFGEKESSLTTYTKQALRGVKTIAVVPFVDAPGAMGKGSGRVVVTATISELYQCPGLKVIERQRLDLMMKEHDLKLSQLQTNEGAKQAGKILGVDTMLIGEVQQYQDNKDFGFVGVGAISGGGTKSEFFVGLAIRAVRVSDGRVIYAELGSGKSKEGISPAAREASKKALEQWKLFFAEENRKKSKPSAS